MVFPNGAVVSWPVSAAVEHASAHAKGMSSWASDYAKSPASIRVMGIGGPGHCCDARG